MHLNDKYNYSNYQIRNTLNNWQTSQVSPELFFRNKKCEWFREISDEFKRWKKNDFEDFLSRIFIWCHKFDNFKKWMCRLKFHLISKWFSVNISFIWWIRWSDFSVFCFSFVEFSNHLRNIFQKFVFWLSSHFLIFFLFDSIFEFFIFYFFSEKFFDCILRFVIYNNEIWNQISRVFFVEIVFFRLFQINHRYDWVNFHVDW